LLSGWHERGYLPHLKEEGGAYFVTFRLADTPLQAVLAQYRAEREGITKRAETRSRVLSPEDETCLRDFYSERVEAYLDVGHVKCWLVVTPLPRRFLPPKSCNQMKQ